MLPVQKRFRINAPQERVWGLLPQVVYQCLPVEKVDIVNEWLFYANLKLRLGFVGLPLKLKVELVDISPPSSFGTRIWIRAGIMRFVMAVTFSLQSANGGKTEVICTAKDEGEQAISKWAFVGQRRRFASNVFDSVMARLQQLC